MMVCTFCAHRMYMAGSLSIYCWKKEQTKKGVVVGGGGLEGKGGSKILPLSVTVQCVHKSHGEERSVLVGVLCERIKVLVPHTPAGQRHARVAGLTNGHVRYKFVARVT